MTIPIWPQTMPFWRVSWMLQHFLSTSYSFFKRQQIDGACMSKKIILLIVSALGLALPSQAQERRWPSRSTPHLSGGVALGYDAGLPIQGHMLVSDLAAGFPLKLRFRLSRSFMRDAGSPEEARRVFINENTNGVPTKSAGHWVGGFDLLHKVDMLSLKEAFVYAGVAYSRFTSTFKFIGGNEFFDVHAKQWGLDAGVESHFRMNPRLDLLCSVGAAYFFPATLEGHDAAYRPNGEMINQRGDYTYDDADHAINQPKLQPKLLIGMNYHF